MPGVAAHACNPHGGWRKDCLRSAATGQDLASAKESREEIGHVFKYNEDKYFCLNT